MHVMAPVASTPASIFVATPGSCRYVELMSRCKWRLLTEAFRLATARAFVLAITFVGVAVAIAVFPCVAAFVPSHRSAVKSDWRRALS